jgi:hypothetical protein
VANALHFEDFELHFGGAANEERLLDDNETMLLVERPGVDCGYHDDWPMMPSLSVMNGQCE